MTAWMHWRHRSRHSSKQQCISTSILMFSSSVYQFSVKLLSRTLACSYVVTRSVIVLSLCRILLFQTPDSYSVIQTLGVISLALDKAVSHVLLLLSGSVVSPSAFGFVVDASSLYGAKLMSLDRQVNVRSLFLLFLVSCSGQITRL